MSGASRERAIASLLSVQAGARLVSRSPTPRTEPLSAIYQVYARSRSLATHYSMGLDYADGLHLFFSSTTWREKIRLIGCIAVTKCGNVAKWSRLDRSLAANRFGGCGGGKRLQFFFLTKRMPNYVSAQQPGFVEAT